MKQITLILSILIAGLYSCTQRSVKSEDLISEKQKEIWRAEDKDTFWDPEPSLPEISFTPKKREGHFKSNVLVYGYQRNLLKSDEVGCIAGIYFTDSSNKTHYLNLGVLTVVGTQQGAESYSVARYRVVRANDLYDKIFSEKLSDLIITTEGNTVVFIFSKKNGFIWNK